MAGGATVPESGKHVVDADNARLRQRRKDDLFHVESTEPPRPDDVCARFVARIEPAWGFAVYGVLYLFVAMAMFTIGVLAATLIAASVGAKGATWAGALAMILGFGLFALTWVGFARWVKRRRAAARPLIRDGVLLDGRVVDKFSGSVGQVAGRVAVDAALDQLGGRFYRVTVEHDGISVMLHVPTVGAFRPAPNTPRKVLFAPGATYALVFDEAGRAHIARVR